MAHLNFKMGFIRRPFFILSTLLLTTGCTSVFYQPDKVLHYRPEAFHLHYEDVRFKSADGTHLVGWFFPADGYDKKNVKGTIVQFHGNGENISTHYLSLVWLVKEGYQLFVFDYRGYGASEGSSDADGVNADGQAGLKKALEFHARLGNQKTKPKFIVFAQSLGGAIGLKAVEAVQPQLDLMVLDSTFLSYKKMARKKLAQSVFTWLFSPLGWLLVSDRYQAEDALKKLKTRTLVIHDKRDPIVPYELGEEVFKLAPEPKTFWTLDNAEHIGIFSNPNDEWRNKFKTFLDALN